MVGLRASEAAERGRRRLLPRGVAGLLLGLAVLGGLPGCGGCRKDPAQAKKAREKRLAEERAKKKKEEEKPPFEVSRLMARPSSGLPGKGSQTPGAPETLGTLYKPGHWTAAALEAKANAAHFVGDLEIRLTDAKQRPIPLLGAPFDLTTSCPVYLAKRTRPKLIESLLFVPPTGRHPRGSCRLAPRKGSRGGWQGISLLRPMPSYQYHFVVLARWPENYTYLRRLASVDPPTDAFSGKAAKPYYRVALIRADKPDPRRRLSLPSYGLLWTSIACVLWDSAEPNALDLLQQEALLDWLHWGGQLIVSGPFSLDKLSGSFLAPYLPVTAAGGDRPLSQEDFEPLRQWSGKSVRRLVPGKNFEGVRLTRHPQAQPLPGSGGLLVERRVGRGRIVVSAFSLSHRALKDWPAVDELLNAFLLRRPARAFRKLAEPDLDDWGESDPWKVEWADGGPLLDARRICNLRYFARDTGLPFRHYGADALGTDLDVDPAAALLGDPAGGVSAWSTSSDPDPSPAPGVAAWTDFNLVAIAARTALQDAAEIEIPDRSFVVLVVAGYLLVLVPANWALFRMMDRVEWAWAAAPAIAVACTVVVVRLAQLDIGFARSRTEIAVVELQGDYPRAHVTRYTALYTSLTTSYEFQFEDPGGLVLPLPKVNRPEDADMRDRRTLLFRRAADARLTGFTVQSNTTGMIHSEQMGDLGGGLSLKETPGGRFELANQTQLTLRGVGVFRRAQDDDLQDHLQIACVDFLEPGATKRFRFSRPSQRQLDEGLWEDLREGLALTRRPPADGELALRGLVELAQGFKLVEAKAASGGRPGAAQHPAGGRWQIVFEDLQPDQVRLLAWAEGQVPGMTIRPAAPQTRSATLVVANLRYGFGEPPQPDRGAQETSQQDGP